jgi:DNA-directed RNA polymerase specialized sigma24 family protein
MMMNDTLTVVRSQSDALIRDEVRALKARAQLERACYEAVKLLGCTVDEVSDASGLTPAEVRRIVAERDGC